MASPARARQPAFHNDRYIYPVGYRAIRAVNKEPRKKAGAAEAEAARKAAAAGGPIAAPVAPGAPPGDAEGGPASPGGAPAKKPKKAPKEKAPEPEKVYIECLITEGKGSFKPVFTTYHVDAGGKRLQGPYVSDTANKSWTQAVDAAGAGGGNASRVVSVS